MPKKKEESYRLTQNACMKLTLEEFGIDVSQVMAEAIMNEFFRLMILQGHLRKED